MSCSVSSKKMLKKQVLPKFEFPNEICQNKPVCCGGSVAIILVRAGESDCGRAPIFAKNVLHVPAIFKLCKQLENYLVNWDVSFPNITSVLLCFSQQIARQFSPPLPGAHSRIAEVCNNYIIFILNIFLGRIFCIWSRLLHCTSQKNISRI